MRYGVKCLFAVSASLIIAPTPVVAQAPKPMKQVSFVLDEGFAVSVHYNTMSEADAVKYGKRLSRKIWKGLCENDARKPCYKSPGHYTVDLFYKKEPHLPTSCSAMVSVTSGEPTPLHQGEFLDYAEISCYPPDGRFSVDHYCYTNSGGSFICPGPEYLPILPSPRHRTSATPP